MIGPQKPATRPLFSSIFHSLILLYPEHLCVHLLTTRIMLLMKVIHEYIYSNRIINSQAQATNLLCFLIVFLDSKSLLFNFFKGGLQLLLFLCKLLSFIFGFFNPLCQLLNHFLICFYLNLSAVNLSAVFINILRSGMDKKEMLTQDGCTSQLLFYNELTLYLQTEFCQL